MGVEFLFGVGVFLVGGVFIEGCRRFCDLSKVLVVVVFSVVLLVVVVLVVCVVKLS